MWYKLTFPKAKLLTVLWRRCVLNTTLNGAGIVAWQKGQEEQCTESNDRKDYATGNTTCVLRT